MSLQWQVVASGLTLASALPPTLRLNLELESHPDSLWEHSRPAETARVAVGAVGAVGQTRYLCFLNTFVHQTPFGNLLHCLLTTSFCVPQHMLFVGSCGCSKTGLNGCKLWFEVGAGTSPELGMKHSWRWVWSAIKNFLPSVRGGGYRSNHSSTARYGLSYSQGKASL